MNFTVVAIWCQIRKQYLMVLTISLQILVRCWPNKLNIVIIQVSLSKSLQIYLFLEPVIDEEIKQIASNFKNKQNCGYNGINMSFVKSLISSTNIIQPCTYICNKSFESGIFPDEMKIA